LLHRIEELATKWFDTLEPILRWDYSLDDMALERYREPFGRLLEVTDRRPSKTIVAELFGQISGSFHQDIIVPVQKYQNYYKEHPAYSHLLDAAIEDEKEYLLEAIDCARTGKLRAAIVLGWSAAVNRLHLHVAHVGVDKFNEASSQMQAITTGRYKRFSKKFSVRDLTELRMSVFDSDLLWVLEFMGAIDGNQHERLGICLTMRNTAAHPGEAAFSEENVASFYSDLHTLVFANPNVPIEVPDS
jgi:hypothetical protein